MGACAPTTQAGVAVGVAAGEGERFVEGFEADLAVDVGSHVFEMLLKIG